MGGVLSLITATRYPVSGVVTLSTIYQLPQDWRIPYLGLIKWFCPEVQKSGKKNSEAVDQVAYPYYPTKSLAELYSLLKIMRSELKNIAVPTLVIHSINDDTVPGANAEAIFQGIGTLQKELVWIKSNRHVITRGEDKEFVCRATKNFIMKCLTETDT